MFYASADVAASPAPSARISEKMLKRCYVEQGKKAFLLW
jgi:hypothetical protein